MLQSFIYNFNPFEGKLFIYYGDYKDFIKAIYPRITNENKATLDNTINDDVLGLTIAEGKRCYIYINPDQSFKEVIATLGHEVLHAIFRITQASGAEYSREGEEFYCYYVSDIIRQVLHKINFRNDIANNINDNSLDSLISDSTKDLVKNNSESSC